MISKVLCKTVQRLAPLSLLLTLATAQAGTSAPATDSSKSTVSNGVQQDDWKVAVSTYGWFAGMEGTVGVRGFTSDIDVPFSKILDHLDMTAALNVEVQKGHWGAWVDGMYLKVSADGSTPGPVLDKVSISAEQTIIEAAVFYRAWEADRGSLDLFAAARYMRAASDLDLDYHDGIRASLPTSFSGSKNWVDPVIGTRASFNFTDHLYLVGKADIGGFGLSSDLTWQLYAALGVHMTPWSFVELGYRHMDVDYTSGGFTNDVQTSGVILALGLKF